MIKPIKSSQKKANASDESKIVQQVSGSLLKTKAFPVIVTYIDLVENFISFLANFGFDFKYVIPVFIAHEMS
jgi:hypothetical protein